MLELVCRQRRPVNLPHSLPKLFMLVFQNQHQSCGLRVEGAGDIEESVFDYLLNPRVWDGGGVAETVHAMAVFDSIEEVCGVCHLELIGIRLGEGSGGIEGPTVDWRWRCRRGRVGD